MTPWFPLRRIRTRLLPGAALLLALAGPPRLHAGEPAPAAKSRFSVEVDDQGHTTIAVQQGASIAVEAQGKRQTVESGHAVQVRAGEPPPTPRASLGAPTPESPAADAVVQAAATGPVAGPVAFAWKPVEGAEGYTVEISGDAAARTPVAKLKSRDPRARLTPGLKPGLYYWRVTARATGRAGLPSELRAFRLEAAPPRLEVEKTRWK